MVKMLRPYQQRAISEAGKAIKSNPEPTLLVASVGSGKSLMIAHIIRKQELIDKNVLMLVHNAELVNNNAKAYREIGGTCGIYCASLDSKDDHTNIIYASTQSVMSAIRNKKPLSERLFHLIVIDECFPGHTLIDGTPISQLKPGDKIKSYNHEANIIEFKAITGISKKKYTGEYICINLTYGVIICTPEHPIYTKNRGYVKAHLVNCKDILYVDRGNVHNMPKKISDRKSPASSLKKIWSGFLLSPLLQLLTQKNNRVINKNDFKKPYGGSKRQSKNDKNNQENGDKTTHPRGKWKRAYRAARKAIKRIRRALGGGIYCKNPSKTRKYLPLSLQNRHGSPTKENSDRSRWKISRDVGKKTARCSKEDDVIQARVESVSVHERASLEQHYPNYQFDKVYNLEVEGNNNYFANGILVHNCHMLNHLDHESSLMRILNHYKRAYPPMRLMGFTGTAFRFNGKSIVGEDKVYKNQIGNITMMNLIKDKYLVRPKFIEVADYIDFSLLKAPPNGFFKGKDLTEILNKNPRKTHYIMTNLVNLVETHQRQGAFIFASTVEHVKECALSLPQDQTGIITGKTPTNERNDILTKARAGEIKYLVNVNVLTVGIDVPNFDIVCFVRPTESLVLFTQMIGRGVRLAPGKKDCWIYDAAMNLERHADWDDPIINEAIQAKPGDEDYIFPCVSCGTLNKMTARRCIGLRDDQDRCEHYFEFKPCPECETQNDITARHCRQCKCEIIDPNEKLEIGGYRVFRVDQFTPTHEYTTCGKSVFTHRYFTKCGKKIINKRYIKNQQDMDNYMTHWLHSTPDGFVYNEVAYVFCKKKKGGRKWVVYNVAGYEPAKEETMS